MRKERIQWMKVGGMPVFSMWSSSFSLQTVSYAKVEKCQNRALHRALLKSILDCLNYLGDLIFTALTYTKTSLESTKHVVCFNNIIQAIGYNTFEKLMTHEVRLMGWNEAASLGDFPVLSNGMIVATLQIRGQ